jgi:CubicO group peptidase (beta-lactamase class C family)
MRVRECENYSYYWRTATWSFALPAVRPLLPLFAATLALGGCAALETSRPVGVPLALAAHEICSGVFISGLPAETVVANTAAPQLGPAAALLRHEVDLSDRRVRASLRGIGAREAVYHGQLGCIVEQGVAPPEVSELTARPALPPLAGPMAVDPPSQALNAALDLTFEEAETGPRRRTYAAVVLHHGRLVAERYAPGVTPATRLHGWSMTKSLTNALLGVLAYQGRLSMNAPAPVAVWRQVGNDPRRAITPDDLMRMRSGLDVGQSLTTRWDAIFDPANQIMFATPDMGAAAAARGLKDGPGSAWRYSDGNTAILGALVHQIAGGGDAEATQRFARVELFDRLGMGPVILETDANGAPIAATQAYASARDWARLGQLYLDDGVAGGRRLLPEGWVTYSTELTPQSGPFRYGAGFWLGGGETGLPEGSYMARGARGQYIVIIPSADLVVVKLGDADNPRVDLRQMAQFVDAVLAAVAR